MHGLPISVFRQAIIDQLLDRFDFLDGLLHHILLGLAHNSGCRRLSILSHLLSIISRYWGSRCRILKLCSTRLDRLGKDIVEGGSVWVLKLLSHDAGH